MAANPNSTFDIGPLSWVKSEIEHSLSEARTHLEKLATSPQDPKVIKYVLTHLHQVTGALSMVGLGAATRFNEEAEKLVASMEPGAPASANLASRIEVTRAAMAALSGYLDALLAGKPDRPMALAKTYIALNQARGATDAAESDLFSPDLSLMMPASDATVVLPKADLMHDTLKQWRGAYQSGLLKLLRDKDIEGGLRGMRSATLAIEALQVTSPTRAFWYAAGGFFDALAANPAETGALAVQLLGKIDQQIKLLVEGVQRVPEKLFRELLLVVGRSTVSTERVQRICDMYRLKELLSLPDTGNESIATDATKSALRALREQIQQQKDHWLKFASGTRPALEPFTGHAEESARIAASLGNKDLGQLLQVIAAIGVYLKKNGLPVNEAQSIEVATALLFVEASTENYQHLGADFGQQCASVMARVKAAMSGAALPAFDGKANPLMGEMSKRAQERMLIFQVGHEVQANLQLIETSLDAYFRDPAKITGLASLAPLFTQIHGALKMLEFDEAATLNQRLQTRVAKLASGQEQGTKESVEAVADGVSGLGLYVSALQQGTPNPREALLPALIRWDLAEKPTRAATDTHSGAVSATDVDVQKQKVAALYEEWKQSPDEASSREQLRGAVEELKADAVVVADSQSARQSEEILNALAARADPGLPSMSGAMQSLVPDKAPEAPRAEAVQLMDAPAAEIDKELLEIFLEEATEVVGTIRDNAATLAVNPRDREALATIRRGYHTLKGSGRMVGLTDLGEVAWSCEQVFNKALKDESSATPGMQRFIGVTVEAFGGWVSALQSTGVAKIDGSAIANYADALKSGREPDFTTPAPIPLLPAEPMVVLDLGEPPAVASGIADAAVPVPPTAPVPPPADMPAEPLAVPAPVEQDVVVGNVVVPSQLFEIYLGEAETHVVALDTEMLAIEENPAGAISQEFMRAAHTLNSSSRTTGFTMIADLASALEKWSQAAIDAQPQWTAARLTTTRNAVDTVGAMVLGLHASELPTAQPELIAALGALREELDLEKRSAESSQLRRPTVPVDAPEPADVVLPQAASETPPPVPPEAPPLVALEQPPPLPRDASMPPPIPVSDVSPPPVPLVSIPPPIPAVALELPPPIPATAMVGAAALGAVAFLAGAEPAAKSTPAAPPAEPTPAAERTTPTEPTAPAAPTVSAEHAEAAVPSASASPLPAEPVEPVISAAPVAEPDARAEEPSANEMGRDRRGISDDVDAELLPIFLEEAREITPQVGSLLRAWRGDPTNHAGVADLARHLHTLKGSSRMAGLMRLGELAHALETRVIDMDRLPSPEASRFDVIDEGLDRFNAAIERFAAGDMNAPVEIPVLADATAALPAPLAKLVAARAEFAEGDKADTRDRQAVLRVNADLIDRFVNHAGELAIARSRIDLEIQAFKRGLTEMSDNVARMRTQLREIEIHAESQIQAVTKDQEVHGTEFDPLEFDRFSRTQELTRFLAESLNDLITLQQSLQSNLDESDAALLQQARLNTDLQQGLMGVRLVPLGNLQDRFYRIVRQTAKELDKKANLEFRGVRVEIDRSVLEKITAPLEHLLRNAVSHGLEKPGERMGKGKSEIGEITIDAQQVGNEVILTLADDGAGLNFARIREKAVQQRLMRADDVLTDSQLAQFIFRAGFTTATEVTQIAGRGVGMDVVKNEIVSLGGRVDITTEAGQGTTFTIALPLTLAVTQAVMVMVGETMYAIPAVMIEQVQEYKGKRYETLLTQSEVAWKENRYPLRSMEALLGGAPKISALQKASVILAKSGNMRAALQVDEIIGNREIVVKTIGPQLARIPGVTGATVLGSGQIVLIMNPVQLVYPEVATMNEERQAAPVATDAAASIPAETARAAPTADDSAAAERRSLAAMIAPTPPVGIAVPAALPARTARLVMVVDDSLTVRKITSRMLARESFEVVTAKDGVDGLQQLQDIMPDLILLDIEMPRMDGFEFAENVRADERIKHIPIIMITSRTADKHRNRAMELGVNEYMGKPYQEDQLIGLIRKHTGLAARAS